MKQLRKIQLKDAVVISDSEMRQIRGGIEETTGVACAKKGTDDGCQDTDSECDRSLRSSALTWRCVWSTGISHDTGKVVGTCGCKTTL